jgi:hypothetical protein
MPKFKKKHDQPKVARLPLGLQQLAGDHPLVQKLLRQRTVPPPWVGTPLAPPLDKLVPKPESKWTRVELQQLVYGEVVHIKKLLEADPGAKGPSLSRQARDLERTVKLYERQAKRDPARADYWRRLAADYRESGTLALEASRLMRDPLGVGSDRRHTIHPANSRLNDLLNFLEDATGSAHYEEISAMLTAAGIPRKANWLRALASRHRRPNPSVRR